MLRAWAVVVGLVIGGGAVVPATLSAQAPISIDRIVARIGDDIVQSLDVRQARVLKLFGPDVATDAAVLDRLIDRRLEVADVARYQLTAPSDADVALRRQRWVTSLGSPSTVDLAALMRDAGMTEPALAAWFRDELRIEALENQRFSSAPATSDEVLTYIREHASELSANGQVDVQDAAVQTRARVAIAAAKRAAAVSAWLDTLRKRAQIIR